MKTDLSARELAVLSFAAQGYTDDMVASELGIQTGTVNSYWVRIRGKLGNLSRSELVARFVQKNADSLHKDHVTQLEGQAANLADENQHILALADQAYSTLMTRTQAVAANLADENRHILEKVGASHDAYVLESETAAAVLADDNRRVLELANAEIERLMALLAKSGE